MKIIFFIILSFFVGYFFFQNVEGFKASEDWNIDINQENDLVFLFKNQQIAKLSKMGEFSSTKCKCGQWNIRDSRMGIPGRNDINLNSDGWVRLLNYGVPEISLGKHEADDFVKGGWAGKNLWYHKSGAGRIHSP